MNICILTICKCQVFVYISWKQIYFNISGDHVIFTVEINYEWLVNGILSTQNKDGVSNWRCCHCRNRCRGNFQIWGWFKTVEIAAGTSSRTIFLNAILNLHIKQEQNYLAGTIKLPCFETGQTIIFALLIILAVVNTTPKGQTVFVYTTVPVCVFFDIIIVQMSWANDWCCCYRCVRLRFRVNFEVLNKR